MTQEKSPAQLRAEADTIRHETRSAPPPNAGVRAAGEQTARRLDAEAAKQKG